MSKKLFFFSIGLLAGLFIFTAVHAEQYAFFFCGDAPLDYRERLLFCRNLEEEGVPYEFTPFGGMNSGHVEIRVDGAYLVRPYPEFYLDAVWWDTFFRNHHVPEENTVFCYWFWA